MGSQAAQPHQALAVNDARRRGIPCGPRLSKERGVLLLATYATIAAFALLLQVFTVRSLTELRVTNWYHSEAQALHAAESGLDATIHGFSNPSTPASCLNYSKTATWDWTDVGSPTDCGTSLKQIYDQAVAALPGSSYQVQIITPDPVGHPEQKIIRVRGFSSFSPTSPSTPAQSQGFQKVATQITLTRVVDEGLAARKTLTIGPFSEVNGDVTVFGIGPGVLHFGKNVWINGVATIGDLSSRYADPLDPTIRDLWIGMSATHDVNLDSGTVVGGVDPSTHTYLQVKAAMTTPHEVDASQGTIYDEPKVQQNSKMGQDFTDALNELGTAAAVTTLKTNLSAAGINCANNDLTTVGDFTDYSPGGPDGGPRVSPTGTGVFCYTGMNTGKNVTLVFASPNANPVTVYLTALIPGNTNQTTMDLSDNTQIYAVDTSNGNAVILDGVKIKIANTDTASNEIHFAHHGTVNGSIYAPTSQVYLGQFPSISGKAVLADGLDINKMGALDIAPHSPGSRTFTVIPSQWVSWSEAPPP